ncbi:MAG: response regulator [Alphaproteobacteria bacterium]|nr:response regulator [Alphaproteobacteria bacterium]
MSRLGKPLILVGATLAIGCGAYLLSLQSVHSLIRKDAERSGTLLATRFVESVDGAEAIMSGLAMNRQRQALFRTVMRFGDAYRIKMFDEDGTLRVDTDYLVDPDDIPKVGEEDRTAVLAVAATGKPKTEFNRAPKGSIRLFYSETYVPVRIDGRLVGIAEVYVYQTGKVELFMSTVKVTAFAIVGLALLAFGLPAMAFLRSSAKLEAQNGLLKDMAARAETAADAKSSFLATMSHELRTPMNAILGFTSLLRQGNLTEEQRDFVETIHGSGESLLRLLNDLLDLSKIEVGSMKLSPRPFGLHDLVTDVVQLLSARAAERHLDLSSYVDPRLPAQLVGDPLAIQKILINLVGNAIKFTSSGAVAVEARMGPIADDGTTREVILTVTDTGIGISPEDQEKIFQRFTQIDSSLNRKYAGTGLGLAICKDLAELMGGSISLESALDQGSSFTVRLPLAEADPPAQAIADTMDRDVSGLHVLVVDDNALNRRIFRLQLEGFGASVRAVPDAVAGLAELRAAAGRGAPFDAAIIDQMMPEVDGLELCTQIRTALPNCPTRLIISSSAGVTSDADARALGFDAALPKPVDQDRLLAVIAATPAAASARAASAREDARGPSPAAGAGTRILLVEDDLTNQKLALASLASSRWQIEVVGNGADAVDAVAARDYDLILMDIQMPVMDGLEATRRIRGLGAMGAHIPIIALTAHAMKGDAEHYLACGMTDYLAKPFDPATLRTLVETYLFPDDIRQADYGT